MNSPSDVGQLKQFDVREQKSFFFRFSHIQNFQTTRSSFSSYFIIFCHLITFSLLVNSLLTHIFFFLEKE